MIRLLMASTALSAVLIGGAFAQSSSSTMDSSMMASSSAMESSAPADTSASSSTETSAMPSSAMESSVMSSQMSTASSMESSMMATPAPRQPVDILSGYTRVDTDKLATKIIGSPVYDGTAADANNLGKISDIVINEDGTIAAVVLGVGGFLGIGEKQVAVDYSALQWVVAADNTERFVLQTTKDDLTNAPDFQTVDDQPNASNAPASNAPATDSTAPAPASTAPASSSAAM